MAPEIEDILYNAPEIIGGEQLRDQSTVEYGPLKLSIAPNVITCCHRVMLQTRSCTANTTGFISIDQFNFTPLTDFVFGAKQTSVPDH
jgi:hypothetical protein